MHDALVLGPFGPWVAPGSSGNLSGEGGGPEPTKLDHLPEMKKWGVVIHAASVRGIDLHALQEMEMWEIACTIGAHQYPKDDKGRVKGRRPSGKPARQTPNIGEPGRPLGEAWDLEWAAQGAQPIGFLAQQAGLAVDQHLQHLPKE